MKDNTFIWGLMTKKSMSWWGSRCSRQLHHITCLHVSVLWCPLQFPRENIVRLVFTPSPHDEHWSSGPRPAKNCSDQQFFQFLFRTIHKKINSRIWFGPVKSNFQFRRLYPYLVFLYIFFFFLIYLRVTQGCVQPDWGYFEWTEQIISINPYKLIQIFFVVKLKNIFIFSK
jgi:hypothetical protein